MELAPLIRDLAIILGAAAIFSLIFKKIKQPLVLGYLVAGLILGPHTPPSPLVMDLPNIKVWAELGIIFLMFSLGLEFSFHKLSRVGVPAGFTAIFEVISMMTVGYFVGKYLNWSSSDSLFLGAMLSISSTTIIIKALDELKLKKRRFAELIFGILIVEDLVAILILVFLSTFASGSGFSGVELALSAAKLIFVVGIWFITGYFFIPRLVRYVARNGNDETITILSLGLCLSLVVIAAQFHYSAALGAFIMGSILAESSESHRIEELIKPLRDIFAAVFFVSVGMLLNPHTILNNIEYILLIALVTIVGKILSTLFGALIMGQSLRTSLQVGFGLAQIGEFSFIIAGLGMSLGVISDSLYPIGVAVSLITTFTTPYLIRISEPIATWIEGRLPHHVKALLTRYDTWHLERRADFALRKLFYNKALKWILNGIVVTACFLIISRYVTPIYTTTLPNPLWANLAGWATSIISAAPFIWGMSVAFAEKPNEMKISPDRVRLPQGAVMFLSHMMTLFWIGFLSLEFISARYIAALIAILAILLFALLYRRLEASYAWFESQFLSTFEASATSRKAEKFQEEFAPWDAHLVRIKIHPNSPFVLKHLHETNLRSQFGLNIVAIQRGENLLIAPGRNDLILPQDEILVLGMDDQIEKIRPSLESSPEGSEREEHISGYELKQLRVEEDSPLVNLQIKDSGMREICHGIIVGVERGSQRLLNPESDLRLISGDIIWVVGRADNLEKLQIKTSPSMD
jgi:CPA2 family monovalent cation:H+ antiporter-2